MAMKNSTQTSPMPIEIPIEVSPEPEKITLKQIVEKAHNRNRKLHDILGGGTAADVLLWRDTISSLTLIFVATEIWFICSSVKLYTTAKLLIGINIFFICQCLVTLLTILYYLPKIDKYLHHQIEETVDAFTKELIRFKVGGENGWHPFGTVNDLIIAVSRNVNQFGELFTKSKEEKSESSTLAAYIERFFKKSDVGLKFLRKMAYDVKEAIFHSGQFQQESLKEVGIFIFNTGSNQVKELVFRWEFKATIVKEIAQIFIMISSHVEDIEDSTFNPKDNKNTIHDHKSNDDSITDNKDNKNTKDDEELTVMTSNDRDDENLAPNYKNDEDSTLHSKYKQHPMKWAIAYLEWLAISTLFFEPATVLYMGYICIATVPALLNYLMVGSQVTKFVKIAN